MSVRGTAATDQILYQFPVEFTRPFRLSRVEDYPAYLAIMDLIQTAAKEEKAGHWLCHCGQVVEDDDRGRRCRGCEDDGDMIQVKFVPDGPGKKAVFAPSLLLVHSLRLHKQVTISMRKVACHYAIWFAGSARCWVRYRIRYRRRFSTKRLAHNLKNRYITQHFHQRHFHHNNIPHRHPFVRNDNRFRNDHFLSSS